MKTNHSNKAQTTTPVATRWHSAYRLARHPISHLPRMMAVVRPKRKVTAAEIALLHSEIF